ncbi:hypothetical protein BB559_005494 [Furculomyces boomerangus]|uniref:Uncharacterized protein n=2 Tax=Harpellales TaxID=61421 RepID=A0A2T9Y4X2_9FUNG|nr:hypothetical protein BB559_006077 [Furculomyces boomerangus]PVU88659.1 hypothetical protein BB559_005494 [Furculomyces boomerangus]PWA00061.1 hypothetical protein BB558_003951 [Smittium angustum]PWA02500.1 hypothetical protein BB558_001305 [Smittium angustum]
MKGTPKQTWITMVGSISVSALIIIAVIKFFIYGFLFTAFFGVHLVINAAFILSAEFVSVESFYKNLGFMYTSIGRGVYYISIGISLIGWSSFIQAIGITLICVGVSHIVFSFTPYSVYKKDEIDI